jgi:hypothetical protein
MSISSGVLAVVTARSVGSGRARGRARRLGARSEAGQPPRVVAVGNLTREGSDNGRSYGGAGRHESQAVPEPVEDLLADPAVGEQRDAVAADGRRPAVTRPAAGVRRVSVPGT